MTRIDPPEDWREREAVSDSGLSIQEKELRMVFPKDQDVGIIGTEIVTIIKWIQSIEEVEVEWVRVNEEGEIIGINARIPKGMLTLKSSSKSSNTHSRMVNYGPYHESEEGEFIGTSIHEMNDD